jgi:hypothetical protein
VVLVEALPVSTWPAELRKRGYPLKEIAGGSRILHTALHTAMEVNSRGELVAVTEGSTRPVSVVIRWRIASCVAQRAALIGSRREAQSCFSTT